MAFNKGEFVLVDYSLRTADDNKIVDTTNAEIATQQNIYNKNREYAPALFVLGEDTPLKKFTDALQKADLNKQIVVNIASANAFGEYDAKKIQIIPISEFKHQKMTPVVGQVINFENGLQAKVKAISGGRVTLDFNHPLAGKDLVVEGKVVENIVEDTKKIKALAKKYLFDEVYAVDVNQDKITLELSNKDIPYNYKALFAKILKKYFKQDKVIFTDTFNNIKKTEDKTSEKHEK